MRASGVWVDTRHEAGEEFGDARHRQVSVLFLEFTHGALVLVTAKQRAQETHEERIYEPAQLTAMLEQAGFTEIKTYGDQSFAPVQGGEDRIYFTARKRD